MQLLVLEEHRRHHRKVRHLLARADGGERLLREHHRLHREEIDAPLGERFRLLAERLDVLLVGRVAERLVLRGQTARGADGARDVQAGRADRAREARALLIQLARPVADPVLVQLEPGAAERVGLDDLAARVVVALVDARDDICVRVVPQLRAGAVRQARREQLGPVAAVEDQHTAAPGALEHLPAVRLHRATSARTPSSCLALMTAAVESLA